MTAIALTLEDVLTGHGFADVPASPLQRAIARAADARPLLETLDVDACQRHFGCDELPSMKPRRVVLIGGIRGGKSLMSCCAAIHGALTAGLARRDELQWEGLKPYEVARFPIVGPTVDAARATYVQLVGILQTSPVLRAFVEGEPTADTIVIRRPDGYRVEIVVTAAHSRGLSVRNRWLAGIVLEEVASFGSEATGAAVNAEDILRAAETRLIPGCQAWCISSPYGPTGLLWELYSNYFGKPGSTLVVHAPTRALNPSFPQERIDEIAREDPDTAAREYGAEWVDADSAYLAATLVDKAIRSAPLVREGLGMAAAIDPAMRSNGWTLAVAWATRETERMHGRDIDLPNDPTRRRVVVGGVWEWRGTKQTPLSPREVFRQIATTLAPFGVKRIVTDQYSFDALVEHASAAGLTLVQHATIARDDETRTADAHAHYKRLRVGLENGLIELPPDPVMRQDLLGIRKRATSNGVKVHLPKTADGRHCDFAPAVALAAYHAEHAAGCAVNFDEVLRLNASAETHDRYSRFMRVDAHYADDDDPPSPRIPF